MNKRGILVLILGLGFVLVSFLIVQSVFPNGDPTKTNEILFPSLLEGMFDYTTDETKIFPAESITFSFSSTSSEIPLLWGLQILDYQTNDNVVITVSNMFGDNFGSFEVNGPILFEMFMIPKNDIYNFEVKNNGNRPISAIMMFAEDPDNSPAMTDPNSTLMNTIIPLAVSGIFLIVGIFVIIIGIILLILDWKRNSKKSRYV